MVDIKKKMYDVGLQSMDIHILFSTSSECHLGTWALLMRLVADGKELFLWWKVSV